MSRTFRLGAFIVATLLIFAAGVFWIGGKQFMFSSTYRLNADFQTVAGLPDGADVRVGGIHEGTIVARLEPGPPAAAVTANGTVRARHAVLALNAWATGWPELRRRIVAWSSYVVLTAPAPERLAAVLWTGGELVSES